MLQAILNKSWRQHATRHQLYGHLPPIMKTIQVRRTRHAGHCWRSRDEFISDVLLWTPTNGRAKAGWPARTCIQQLCEDTGYGPEDLPEAMKDREKWRERVRDIRACGMTWWWWLSSKYDYTLVGWLIRWFYGTSTIVRLYCRRQQHTTAIIVIIITATLTRGPAYSGLMLELDRVGIYKQTYPMRCSSQSQSKEWTGQHVHIGISQCAINSSFIEDWFTLVFALLKTFVLA